jgi:transcriptional regulator with XRE-family HTH domain
MGTKQLKPRPPEVHQWAWYARVKELRVAKAELNVKVHRMASDLGRNRSHLSDVMRGYQRPSEELAREIAEYFGKPVESLFFKVDLENPDQASAA